MFGSLSALAHTNSYTVLIFSSSIQVTIYKASHHHDVSNQWNYQPNIKEKNPVLPLRTRLNILSLLILALLYQVLALLHDLLFIQGQPEYYSVKRCVILQPYIEINPMFPIYTEIHKLRFAHSY